MLGTVRNSESKMRIRILWKHEEEVEMVHKVIDSSCMQYCANYNLFDKCRPKQRSATNEMSNSDKKTYEENECLVNKIECVCLVSSVCEHGYRIACHMVSS